MGGRGASGRGGTIASFEQRNGLTYVTQDFGGGYGRVGVIKPGQGEVASINWMPGRSAPEVGDLFVSEGMRRQGIASQLWKSAQKATSGKLAHSANRTAAGDAFARAVGGNTPRRSSLRPV